MIVCSCRRVNDHAVREAIASGARDVREVGAQCGAGSRCGGCWPTLDALLEQLAGPQPAAAA